MPRGRLNKLENKQFCKMLSGMTKPDQCLVLPDIPVVKATHSLTSYGRLHDEVFVVGKQFSGVLLY